MTQISRETSNGCLDGARVAFEFKKVAVSRSRPRHCYTSGRFCNAFAYYKYGQRKNKQISQTRLETKHSRFRVRVQSNVVARPSGRQSSKRGRFRFDAFRSYRKSNRRNTDCKFISRNAEARDFQRKSINTFKQK